MAYLLDTNVLVRLANAADVQSPTAFRAVAELHRLGEIVHITPQNLIEFRAVATRPIASNGLGRVYTVAEHKADEFEAMFPLLPDHPDVFPAWKSIVATGGVIGKQVHDARLVAVCRVYRISHLLTFNVAHFARYATANAGLAIVDPTSV